MSHCCHWRKPSIHVNLFRSAHPVPVDCIDGNQTCLNGACMTTASGVICHCHHGYTGDACETDIDDCERVTCLNNGTCVDGVAEYHCNCSQGYEGPAVKKDVLARKRVRGGCS